MVGRPSTRASGHPLAEAGLTKADVRALAKAYGLPNWDKPAAPCLATRIPYGQRVTLEKLRQLEAAERVVRDLGFRESRVRHHGDVARVEVLAEQLERAAAPDVREAMVRGLQRLGFHYVALDLQGYRSGSLNEVLGPMAAGPIRPALPIFTTAPDRSWRRQDG